MESEETQDYVREAKRCSRKKWKGGFLYQVRSVFRRKSVQREFTQLPTVGVCGD